MTSSTTLPYNTPTQLVVQGVTITLTRVPLSQILTPVGCTCDRPEVGGAPACPHHT